MKRYIHAKEQLPHLSDLIRKISFIVICDDIERMPLTISSSEDVDLPDGQELTDEQDMITWPDSYLLDLTEEEVHQLTNFELLNRIAKLAKDKLSRKQVVDLQKHNRSAKFIVDEADVENIIEMLKNCKQISYAGFHKKTSRFAVDSEGEFREEDCIKIIRNLKVEDYVTSGHSDNYMFLGNTVIIFQPSTDWTLNNGMTLKDFTIYVKLDIDETTKVAAALISFHDTILDDPHPYANK